MAGGGIALGVALESVDKGITMTKKKVFRVLKYALTGLWWTVLLLGAVLVINFLSAHFRGEVPRIGKYSVMHIVSDSMEPSIPKDMYILIKRVPAEEVKKDDVICFYSTDPVIYGRPNTHRVVEQPYEENGELYFVTMGDNNLIPDKEPAKAEHLIGVWVRNLEGFTSFLNFVTQNFIVIFAVLVVLGAGASVATLFWGGKKPNAEQKKESEEK